MVGKITFNNDFSLEIPVFGEMGLLFGFGGVLFCFFSSCINSGDIKGWVSFFKETCTEVVHILLIQVVTWNRKFLGVVLCCHVETLCPTKGSLISPCSNSNMGIPSFSILLDGYIKSYMKLQEKQKYQQSLSTEGSKTSVCV